MDISVIVPIYNEAESLPELIKWIRRVMEQNQFSYEVLMVDDGSNDDSWTIIRDLASEDKQIRGIKFRRNYGKSAALHVGFQSADGDVVITMDADLQDSPDEIPSLYSMIKNEGYDLVSGWKKKRYDPLSKTIPTKLYNWTTRRVTGVKLHDMNCGLKAYRKNVVKNIEVYGEMHRYIPVLANKAGFKKIGEKIVQHQRRKYGKTKFGGLNRFLNGFLDLLSVSFITRFGKKPMHFFGVMGTLVFILGFFAAFWLGAQKLYDLNYHIKARLVIESPYFFIALTAMIIGSQLFLAGFLGELVSRSSSDRNVYQVEEKI